MLKQGLIVSAGTMLSRVLGLVRDIMIAIIFGVSEQTDAFFIAFKIPNFFRRLFAEGSFSQAFIPILGEYSNKSDAEIQLFLNQVFSWLLCFLVPITLIGLIFTEYLLKIYAFNLSVAENGSRYNMTVDLLRITFSYLLFISLTAFCSAILQSFNKFAVASITPVFLNISFIVAMLWGINYVQEPIYALAWAVLFAGVIQLGFQLPFLWHINKLPKPTIVKKHSGVMAIMRLMLPTLFAASVNQVNSLINIQLAAFLAVGSISWLSYGDRLMSFPIAIIGIAVATVILPQLSKKFALNNKKEFVDILSWGIKIVCIVGLPATLGLLMLTNDIVATLFFYGTILQKTDVQNISLALQAYAIGLPFFMLTKIFTAALFSQKNSKFAVKAGIIAVAVNLLFALTLIFWLEFVALALATSIAAIANSTILAWHLSSNKYIIWKKNQAIIAIKIILALVGMAFTIWLLAIDYQELLSKNWFNRSAYLMIVVIVAAISYFGLLRLQGIGIKDFKLQ